MASSSKMSAPSHQAYDPSQVEAAILNQMSGRADIAPSMMYPFYLNARDDRAAAGQQYSEQLQNSNQMASILAQREMALEDAKSRRTGALSVLKDGNPSMAIRTLQALGIADPDTEPLASLQTGLGFNKTKAETLESYGKAADSLAQGGLRPTSNTGTIEQLLAHLGKRTPTSVEAAGAGNPSNGKTTVEVSNAGAQGSPVVKGTLPNNDPAQGKRVIQDLRMIAGHDPNGGPTTGLDVTTGKSNTNSSTGAPTNVGTNNLTTIQRASLQNATAIASAEGNVVSHIKDAKGTMFILKDGVNIGGVDLQGRKVAPPSNKSPLTSSPYTQ